MTVGAVGRRGGVEGVSVIGTTLGSGTGRGAMGATTLGDGAGIGAGALLVATLGDDAGMDWDFLAESWKIAESSRKA